MWKSFTKYQKIGQMIKIIHRSNYLKTFLIFNNNPSLKFENLKKIYIRKTFYQTKIVSPHY